MAEDLEEDYEEDGEGAGAAGGAAKKKKLVILLAFPLLLIVGGVAGAYFAGLFGGGAGEAAQAEGPPPAEHGEASQGEPGAGTVFYDLPEMLVDLNGRGRKRSFLKIRVSLELENSLEVPVIESVLPRIIDNFQVYLRELRLEDLKGAAGVYRLREELLVRVNAAARPARVNDVLFKEMLIQ